MAAAAAFVDNLHLRAGAGGEAAEGLVAVGSGVTALVPALRVAAASPVCVDSSVKCWAVLPPKVEVTSSCSFLFVFLFPEFLCFLCNKGWAEAVCSPLEHNPG